MEINMTKEEIKNYIYKLKREKNQLKTRLKEIKKIEKIILISLLDNKLANDIIEEILK